MEKQIKLFLEFLENDKKLSSNTLQSYKRDITQYQEYIDKNGLNFSRHRITVSTSGITDHIHDFARRFQVKLAISLHAPNDEVRSKIMPINKKYNVHKAFKRRTRTFC